MSAAERSVVALAAIALALATGCASLPAPRDYVPTPNEAPQNVRGSWVNVRYAYHEGVRATTSGELLAVSEDSIFVATTGRSMAYDWRVVNRVQVVSYDPQESACYGLAAGGAASTLAHGWFLAISFPVWLIIGATTGSGRVGEAVLTYPGETEDWRDLRPYARFPAGIPSVLTTAADSTGAATPPIATAPPPGEVPPIPAYKPARRQGNGFVFGGGFFEEGKGAWSVGYHGRVHSELFLLGGYTNFDDDVVDMEQWWAGVRLGDPGFVGVKYIYTIHSDFPSEIFGDSENSGVSAFAGFLAPTSQHVGVGLMGGYDWTGLDYPYREDFWWVTALLQLTLFPAEEP